MLVEKSRGIVGGDAQRLPDQIQPVGPQTRQRRWLSVVLFGSVAAGLALGVGLLGGGWTHRRSVRQLREDLGEPLVEEAAKATWRSGEWHAFRAAGPIGALSRGDDRYLALLKRSLTGTLFTPEPDCNQPDQMRFVMEFSQHYTKGPAVSMLPLGRLDQLQDCIVDVVAQGVPGDLIETGVWRGGATIFMRAVLKALDVRDRHVWVADSFEGLPEPDPEKYPVEAKAYHGPVMTKALNRLAVGLEEVQRNFQAYDMLDGNVRFLEGWFKDTLPTAPIERLAVLRIDGDFYESTMDALRGLYPKLSIGGYAIVDDYGEESWTYCRRAVDDFRAAERIADPIVHVDSRCIYWRRTT
jgi:hypothetical protein